MTLAGGGRGPWVGECEGRLRRSLPKPQATHRARTSSSRASSFSRSDGTSDARPSSSDPFLRALDAVPALLAAAAAASCLSAMRRRASAAADALLEAELEAAFRPAAVALVGPRRAALLGLLDSSSPSSSSGCPSAASQLTLIFSPMFIGPALSPRAALLEK